MEQEPRELLSVDSLKEADNLIRNCFLQISEGNGITSFPDEICGEGMTKFLEIMKAMEIQLTTLHSDFLQDEQKRITKVPNKRNKSMQQTIY